ncbi:MAG: Fic family protein [Desulfobacteraceae bacterium]|nr:MAG: Fic family protein [Desulfobacteraceae bacterium]
MRYLSLLEILELHENIIETSGGASGIRDIRALESAFNQPHLTFNQSDLYPDIISKAAALYFFLINESPFY